MASLQFPDNTFDLIWSEGAIYIMGFEAGLTSWQKFLKPGGFVAVSEVCWQKDSPPEELKAFWQSEYPAIQPVDKNSDIIAGLNLELIAHFPLPAKAWWHDYYQPMIKLIAEYRRKSPTPEMQSFLAGLEEEISIFHRYSAYYVYEFFIMQKKIF